MRCKVFHSRAVFTALFVSVLAAVPGAAQSHGAVLSSSVQMERRFRELHNSPPELYAFLYRMPKGGDLHNHLAGAIYAETFLRQAAQDRLCIDRTALALIPRVAAECEAGQVDAALTQTDNALENAMIDSLSMRDFVPGAQSAHDHFFGAFEKFSAVSGPHAGEGVAEVVSRAAAQNESYLELMALSGGGPISDLGKRIGLQGDFDSTFKQLEGAGLPELVSGMRVRLDQIESKRTRLLGCEQNRDSAPCRVEVRYIFQVLRESPKAAVFAQVMAGFALAAADPRVVSVNLVQPEDGLISMRDYHLHMQMVDYAKRLYPGVHITLHAGELALGLVPPNGLRFHIREAVELGHAERIGHGVDVTYETNADQLLAEMRERHVAVEINLTSNDLILGISGNRHPFPVYRAYGVPVVLSTDDEGVSRTHLTEEFVRAVTTYNLTYADVKQMVRNSLEYSFAPGASYWTNRDYSKPVSNCASGTHTAPCGEFFRKNEKARLEADLEARFADFEKSTVTTGTK